MLTPCYYQYKPQRDIVLDYMTNLMRTYETIATFVTTHHRHIYPKMTAVQRSGTQVVHSSGEVKALFGSESSLKSTTAMIITADLTAESSSGS